MDLKTFVTYSFDPNVGKADRIFRVLSGLALAIVPLVISLPLWGTIALVVAGVAWLMTGLLSRCGMYYLLGHSTCPASKS